MCGGSKNQGVCPAKRVGLRRKFWSVSRTKSCCSCGLRMARGCAPHQCSPRSTLQTKGAHSSCARANGSRLRSPSHSHARRRHGTVRRVRTKLSATADSFDTGLRTRCSLAGGSSGERPLASVPLVAKASCGRDERVFGQRWPTSKIRGRQVKEPTECPGLHAKPQPRSRPRGPSPKPSPPPSQPARPQEDRQRLLLQPLLPQEPLRKLLLPNQFARLRPSPHELLQRSSTRRVSERAQRQRSPPALPPSSRPNLQLRHAPRPRRSQRSAPCAP